MVIRVSEGIGICFDANGGPVLLGKDAFLLQATAKVEGRQLGVHPLLAVNGARWRRKRSRELKLEPSSSGPFERIHQ